jgi:hypothetical protein
MTQNNDDNCNIECAGKSIDLRRNRFIEKSKKVHGEKYGYDKVIYVDAQTTVEIYCNVHKEYYKQTPASHVRGTNCPKCTYMKMKKVFASTTKEFIEKSILLHGDKYGYEEVIYTNCGTKVKIYCRKHNDFFVQTPNTHLDGSGCPKCAWERVKTVRAFTNEEFVKKSIDTHGNNFDYADTKYVNSYTKVNVTCKKHNQSFEIRPSYHIHGTGCKVCKSENMKIFREKTTENFIKKSQQIHGNRYNYEKSVYVNKQTPVIIICDFHGDFLQTPPLHYGGAGCYKCRLCPTCQIWRTWGKICDYCQPLDQNKYYMRTKEMKVVDYLRDNYVDHEFIHNKSVGNDCTGTHLFPDIRFDIIKYNLIIEIDEHQHRGAAYSCDEARMYDIIAKLGTPCIFIRYNPDNKLSNEEKLVETIRKYNNIELDDAEWNDYGLIVKYLFYKNIEE